MLICNHSPAGAASGAAAPAYTTRPSAGATTASWSSGGYRSGSLKKNAKNPASETMGSAQAGRLPAARQRRLVDNFYVPLAELSALGMTDLQGREDIARLYSQSAGLATFFMHYAAGQYRPAWVKLSTIEELTGQSFATLDQQYREFLAVEVVAQSTRSQPEPGVFHVPTVSPSDTTGNPR